MATVAPAAEAATSALKVITEMVTRARLSFRMMGTLLPSVADTNSDDVRVIAPVAAASNYTRPGINCKA